MPALLQNIYMKQGTSRSLTIGPIVDSSGNYVNLAGASAIWALAKSETSTGSNILLTKGPGGDVTVPSSVDPYGATYYTVNIVIHPNDTKPPFPASIPPTYWYHECQVTDALGNITTVATGHFYLYPSIINHA